MKFPIKIFQKKDFSLLLFAKLISLFGTEMQGFALSLYVLKTTGSAKKFASVMALVIIPKLILGPIAGVLVDWFDRKKIIVYLDVFSGIVVAIYAILFKNYGALHMVHIYSLSILLSIVSLLYNPATSVVIPSIVEKEELVDANSMNSFVMSFGSFLSPILAGLLLGFYSIFVILVMNSISFIIAAVAEIFIKIPKTNNRPKEISIRVFGRDFKEGISFIVKTKALFNIIILALTVNFVFTPSLSLGLTYISKQVLKISDSQFGLIQSSVVVFMMFAPFISNKVCKKMDLNKIVFLGLLCISAILALWAAVCSPVYLNIFSTNFIPYLSLIAIVCMLMIVLSVVNMAIGVWFQQIVPLEIMGRASTAMNFGAMAINPIGFIVYGYLFDKLPAWICLTTSALFLFMIIIAFRNRLYKDEKQGKAAQENLCEM